MKLKPAYTLVEILIVIGIVLILSGIVITVINPLLQRNRASDAIIKKSVGEVAGAMEIFKAVYGRYPADSDLNNLTGYISAGYKVYLANPAPDAVIGFNNTAIETGTESSSIYWDISEECLQAGSIEIPGQFIIWKPDQEVTENSTGCSVTIASIGDTDTGPSETNTAVNPGSTPVGTEFNPAGGNANGLVAHYKMDETGGNFVEDSSGNLNNATAMNGASRIEGVTGNAINLDGSTQYVQIPNVLFDSPRSVSLTAWIRPMSVDSSGGEIISLGDYVAMRVTNTDVHGFYYSGAGEWKITSFNQVLVNKGWAHVAFVFDDGISTNTQRLYVNGNLMTTTTHAQSINYAGLGTNTDIGRHANGSTSYDFRGRIDDVKIYNYALNINEVRSDANYPVPPNATPICNLAVNPDLSNYDDNVTLNFTVNATDDDDVTHAISTSSPSCGAFTSGQSTSTPVFLTSATSTPQACTIQATVTDGLGQQGTCSRDINTHRANTPPTCTISMSPSTNPMAPNSTVNFTVNGIDQDAITYSTSVNTPNCGAFTSGQTTANPVFKTSYELSGKTCTVIATVTDTLSQQGTCTQEISTRDLLVAQYSFDEGSGTTLLDSAGKGASSGTLVGGSYSSTVVPKNSIKSLYFGTTPNHLGHIPHSSALNLSEGTMTFLFRRQTYTPGYQKVILSRSLSDTRNGELVFYFTIGSTSPLTLQTNDMDGSQRNINIPGSNIAANVWYLLVFKFNSTSKEVELINMENGNRNTATSSRGFQLSTLPIDILIGAHAQTGYGYSGSGLPPTGTTFYLYNLPGWVDELKIYNKKLTSQEIDSLYQSYRVP